MSNHLNWTSTLIRSLYRAGVRHAVISPGSRSTPITIAAAIHTGIKTNVILDERSAGFVALGIGKATGLPAILICTSGTAAANYFPAVIEAKESGVPMIVLSADRPPNLRGIGSSQTIDQIKLFGDHAVQFHDTGEPRFEDEDLRRLEYLGNHAVKTAIDSSGAVHINMPFRKPLEPTEEQVDHEISSLKREIEKDSIQQVVSSVRRKISFGNDILSAINSSKKPLIICGPSNPHQSLAPKASELSDFLNAPVIAEPGSGFVATHDNKILRYEQFLRDGKNAEQLQPDLILRFGDQPFTKSLIQTLEFWRDVTVIHFSSRKSVQDHAMSVDHVVECSAEDTFNYQDLKSSAGENWIKSWRELDIDANSKLESALSQTEVLTDGTVFAFLNQAMKPNWNCMLSNSFIPRDMALFGNSNPNQFVNRGAAGIDGITSTATGISCSSNKKTVCITGDLAFLHDSNALLSVKQSEEPLIIVVINNGGGTIFNMLPVSSMEQYFEEFFITPQNVSIEKLANAHEISHIKIKGKEELKKLDLSAISTHTVVECITDSDESMKLRKTLWNS